MGGNTNSTPWAELQRLAASGRFKGHYLADAPNMPEVQPEYIELAQRRQYEPDDRKVEGRFDDRLKFFFPGEELARASSSVYGFLESLGAKMIPHGSQGTPDYSAVMRGELARGEGELDHGSFFAHLVGNEQCLREWQKAMGSDVISDAACLGGLLHSLYGTQGYQAAQFPFEKRDQIRALVGDAAENLAFWTCAMERKTWRAFVLANKGLQRGEKPVGHFSGRRTALGKPANTPFTGEEQWSLTASEFTDMCAVQLSHVLQQANNGNTMTSGDEALDIMAEHLGGAAEEQYRAEVAALNGKKTLEFGNGCGCLAAHCLASRLARIGQLVAVHVSCLYRTSHNLLLGWMLLRSGTPADIVKAEEHEAYMNKVYVAEAETLRTEQTVDAQAEPEPSPAHGKARL